MGPSLPLPSPTERTAELLRLQADACRDMGSALYGDLLAHASEDLRAGGPVAAVLAGHLEARIGSVLALRLLGGAHALALAGKAPDLAAWYPSAGGRLDADRGSPHAWAALRRTLADQREAIRQWLERPPQTNEVGRSAALLGGLLSLTARHQLPVRLVEVGASAGLNLRADHYRVEGDVASYGDPASPVVLRHAWQGYPPPQGRVDIIERIGGDVAPLDPNSAADRLTLAAYVWPDQAERLARLRGALDVAGRVPAELRAESATDTVGRIELVSGTWTVVWHSIFRQYLNQTQRAELAEGIAGLGAAATGESRFAYLYLEQSRTDGCKVILTTWPGGVRQDLGTGSPHGIPVRWNPAA